jgi:hypothetical protein
MLWLLLGIAAMVLGGVVGLIFTPLYVTFWIRGEALTWAMGFQAHWLGRQFGDEWLIPKTPAAHASRGMSFDPSLVKDGLWMLSWYRHFIRRAWPQVQMTHFDCDAIVGLGEASDTGLLVGPISSLLGWWLVERIVPQSQKIRPRMHVEPNWNRPEFCFRLTTKFWLRPSAMVRAAIESLGAQAFGRWPIHTIRRVQHGHSPDGRLG